MREEEIRPEFIFDEYLRLTKIDIKVFFDNALRESILCPACGTKGVPAFNKHGFDYELCVSCDTLFVSPRPVNDCCSSAKGGARTLYERLFESSLESPSLRLERIA